MNKRIRFNGIITIDNKSNEVNISGIAAADFKQLKPIGKYSSREGSSWVQIGNITFFKSHKPI